MLRMFHLVLLSVVGFVSCHSADGPYFGRTVPRHPPTEIWINNSAEAETLDPGKCADANGGEILWNMFAGLVQTHPKTLQPMPDLAETWKISSDRKLYTFHLRESRWSDGTPLTAEDFAWSWKRVIDPSTGSRNAAIYFPILNAEPFHERAIFFADPADRIRLKADLKGKIPDLSIVDRIVRSETMRGIWIYVSGKDASDLNRNREIVLGRLGPSSRRVTADDVGVRAVGPTILEVRLESAIPYFLDLASHFSFMPVPRHLLERLAREKKNPDLWTRPEYSVSNGPYLMKQWKFRLTMVFERNPLYWDAKSVRLERVRMFMVEKGSTLMNFYRTADFDWTGRNGSLPIEFVDRLAQYRDFSRDPFLGVYFYWVNTKTPPLDNVKLRRALNLAIDRDAIVKYVTRAHQVPSADLVPDGLAGYPGLHSPLFDPPAARKLLHEAGYENGGSVPPITLIYNTSEGHKSIAEAIQQMWKKELGIRVQLENQEWKVFLRNQSMKNFQISRMGWVGDYPDPYTFLQIFVSSDGNNQSNWGSRKYDGLLNEANRIADPAARLASLRKAEEILRDEVPLFPVYVYTRNYLKKPYVLGHWPNFQDRHPWKYMWIDERWYKGIPSDAGLH